MSKTALSIPYIHELFLKYANIADLHRERSVPIENLVFEGGGVKGLVYAGAIEVLEAENILKGVKRVAGSSAGGITALLLGFGFSVSEIKRIMSDEIDFTQLMDRRITWDPTRVINLAGMSIGITDIVMLFKNKGLYKGDAFVQVVKAILKKKVEENLKTHIQKIYKDKINELKDTGSDAEIEMFVQGKMLELLDKYYINDLGNITFEQFEKLKSEFPEWNLKSIYLTGTKLSDGSLRVFSRDSDPTMSIVDAVRITMSFPFGFEPVLYQGEYYADGGIADNYPMHIFNAEQFQTHGLNQSGVNPCTLGFLVDSKEEIGVRWGKKEPAQNELSIKKFAGSVLSGIHNRWEILKDIYNIQSIQIDDLGVPTMDLALSAQMKAKLIDSGREPTQFYFDNYYNKKDILSTLPEYEDFLEKYYSKGQPELKRIIETEIWPILNEVHTINIAFNTLPISDLLAEVKNKLNLCDEAIIQNEALRIERTHKYEHHLETINLQIDNLTTKISLLDSDIRNCQRRIKNLADIPDERQGQDLSEIYNRLKEEKKKYKRKFQKVESNRNSILEEVQKEYKQADNYVFNLLIKEQEYTLFQENRFIEKLQEIELKLHEQLDLALDAIHGYQRSYPDPRTSTEYEKNIFLMTQKLHQKYFNTFLNILKYDDIQSGENANRCIELIDAMLKMGYSLEASESVLSFYLRSKKFSGLTDKKMAADILFKIFVSELEENILLENYLPLNALFEKAMIEHYDVGASIAESALFAQQRCYEKCVELERIRMAQKWVVTPSEDENIYYAESLRKTTRQLSIGKWGDQIVVENQDCASYNLQRLNTKDKETYGKMSTNYTVQTITRKEFNNPSIGKDSLPVIAHILTPESLHLKNTSIDQKEIIVAFQASDLESDKFSVASLHSQQRIKQFEECKEEIINQILWNIRQSKEIARPNNSTYKITIHGEGLAGQDAQYLLQALLDEIKSCSHREGLMDISKINLVLVDPSRVDVQCALDLKSNIQKLNEYKLMPELLGYTLINHSKIGKENYNRLAQNYIGDANILGFLAADEATVKVDFVDHERPNIRLQSYSNKESSVDNIVNVSNYIYKQAWFRYLYMAGTNIKNIAKAILVDFMPNVVLSFVKLPFQIGWNILKRFTNPFVRIFKRFGRNIELPQKINWLENKKQSHLNEKKVKKGKFFDKEKFQKELLQGIAYNEKKITTLLSESTISERLKQETRPPIENIVFEGGGVKGIAYVGAIEAMERNGMLKDVKRVAGSSAGGITASLVALGYNAEELKNIFINEINFDELMDEPFDLGGIDALFEASGMSVSLSGIVSLFKNKGLFKGENFDSLLKKLIHRKLEHKLKEMLFNALTEDDLIKIYQPQDPSLLTDEEKNHLIDQFLTERLSAFLEKENITNLSEITLGQLKTLRKKYPTLGLLDIILTATDLGDASLKTFSAESDKDLPLHKAVRMTMSFPGGFMPVNYNNRWYADGGIANNYPIEVFDQPKYLSHGRNHAGVNPCTLGILIDSQEEIQSRWGIRVESETTLTLPSFIASVLYGMHNRSEILRDRYNINSIQIIDDIGSEGQYKPTATMDLNLNIADKLKLYQNGASALDSYHALYMGENVQYHLVDSYKNLEQKYYSKSVKEMKNIFQTEIIPLIQQFEMMLPYLDRWESKVQKEIADNDLSLNNEIESILIKIENRTYQVQALEKDNALFEKNMQILNEKLNASQTAYQHLKSKIDNHTATESEILLEPTLFKEYQKAQDLVAEKSKRREIFLQKNINLKNEIDGLQKVLIKYNEKDISAVKKLRVLNDYIILIQQAREAHAFLLKEKAILLKAANLKGKDLSEKQEINTTIKKSESDMMHDLFREYYTSSESALQFSLYDNGGNHSSSDAKNKYMSQLLNVFNDSQWIEESDRNSSRFVAMGEKNIFAQIDFTDTTARFSGTAFHELNKAAALYQQTYQNDELEVDYDIEADTLEDGLAILKNLNQSGFNVNLVKKMYLKSELVVEDDAFEKMKQDVIRDLKNIALR
ncbi:patatin-like phospholipase family protein [Candidatus Berkiella cookevillensis]|uniref:Patatin-like phospholipase family protein n=1 Tax=Candidatus Berkiella cookevillensis TaxID=437022 RepID=A0A0Q9YRA0_9GAMM|nr:patatin-like phospholipase family protein [Candidatus Berkiella cookevillensis]MCS5708924.1 patatin-like phospholipase family protein [Candidatus Berkiella cookevillensis]